MRIDKFPKGTLTNRNAPFHEALLKAFEDNLSETISNIPLFISLSSWSHGLNTTLGSTFFEKIAHILSNGEKREYTSKKKGNLELTKQQKEAVSHIITNLSTSEITPNLKEENKLIFINSGTEKVNAINFSIDVFIEKKDKIIGIEMKSVRPNSGEMRGEKQKILEGKAALYNTFKNKEIHFYIGFPFDPTNESDNPVEYDKSRFLDSIINMRKFFAEDEVLLADELWNFLSRQRNTMEQILEIIKDISTPDFLDKFNFLEDRDNFKEDPDKYSNYLKEWHLESELYLIENDNVISKFISKSKSLANKYNQSMFKIKKSNNMITDVFYNEKRYQALKSLIPQEKETLTKLIKKS